MIASNDNIKIAYEDDRYVVHIHGVRKDFNAYLAAKDFIDQYCVYEKPADVFCDNFWG